jgi:hypothetical protein
LYPVSKSTMHFAKYRRFVIRSHFLFLLTRSTYSGRIGSCPHLNPQEKEKNTRGTRSWPWQSTANGKSLQHFPALSPLCMSVHSTSFSTEK